MFLMLYIMLLLLLVDFIPDLEGLVVESVTCK